MDYEKKYKEALEKAENALRTDLHESGVWAIKRIFPELAESEDERMIKAITHILYENYSDAAVIEGVEIAEIVTWLEKQKEKSEKPIIPEKENEVMEAIEGTIRVYGKTQGEWIAGYDMDTLVVHLRKAFAALEKQKESLHITETCKENADSFTDEDERIRKSLVEYFSKFNPADMWDDNFSFSQILAYLEKQKDKQNLIEKSLDSYMTDPDGYLKDWSNAYDKGFEAAKELFIAQPEKYGLQKQKEQNVVPSRETILGIWELGNLWKENPEERNGLTQLQYIQKYWFEKCDYQKEQKPAEWSEEDEKTRNSIIEAIHNLWPYEHRDKCIQWLKSLPERFNLSSKQEQPDVDFEKAYKFYIKSRKDDLTGNAVTVNMKDLSRHFYELGLNARK